MSSQVRGPYPLLLFPVLPHHLSGGVWQHSPRSLIVCHLEADANQVCNMKILLFLVTVFFYVLGICDTFLCLGSGVYKSPRVLLGSRTRQATVLSCLVSYLLIVGGFSVSVHFRGGYGMFLIPFGEYNGDYISCEVD